jgi:hypothetical protein
VVPRGVEPRSSAFQTDANRTISAKAPFVCDKYWLTPYFIITEFTYQQTERRVQESNLPGFYPDADLASHCNTALPTLLFYFFVTSCGNACHRSLLPVPPSSGIAHCIVPSAVQLRRERESNPRTCNSQLFSRQPPRPAGLSPGVSGWIQTNSVSKTADLQSATTLQLRRTHIQPIPVNSIFTGVSREQNDSNIHLMVNNQLFCL